jgi:hypothetical protein
MRTTTLSIKTTAAFAKKYRAFCDQHALQIGKFSEQMLSELMEDYYFGTKAQRVLSQTSGSITKHEAYFKKTRSGKKAP